MKKVLMIAAAAAFMLSGMAVTEAVAGPEGKCKACHDFGPKNKVGPALKGVVGRKAGTAKGFKYKFTKYGSDWTWDEEHLREWMCNSKKAIKKFTGNPKAKTKMAPQKICDKAKQDAVLAALKAI